MTYRWEVTVRYWRHNYRERPYVSAETPASVLADTRDELYEKVRKMRNAREVPYDEFNLSRGTYWNYDCTIQSVTEEVAPQPQVVYAEDNHPEEGQHANTHRRYPHRAQYGKARRAAARGRR